MAKVEPESQPVAHPELGTSTMAAGSRQETHAAPAVAAGRSPGRTEARRRITVLLGLAVIALAAGLWASHWLVQSSQNRRLDRAQTEQVSLSETDDRMPTIKRPELPRQSPHLETLLQGQHAAARHEPDAALIVLNRVPDDHELAAKARLLAGQIELRRDGVRRAEELFQAALRLDSSLVQAHRELIYIYGVQLRRAELSDQFLALSRLTPLTADNVFHWCLLRNNSWEPGEAAATLLRFVAADPTDRPSRIALAENYRRAGQIDSAESVLAPLAADDTKALVIRVRIAVDRQQPDRAERLLETSKADDSALATLRGRMALAKRDARSAVHHFRLAFQSDPDDRETVFGLVCALLLAQEPVAAEPFRAQARNLERLNTLVNRAAGPSARQDPKLLRELGQACAALHRHTEARAWYELAIARDPLDHDSQRALYHLRDTFRSTGPTSRPLLDSTSLSF